MTARSLSLVVPVFNGQDLACAAVRALPSLEQTAASCGFELVEAIFVDDGSAPPLELSGSKCRVIRMEANSGKGAAVRCGALAAKGEWVLMSDVDMSAPFTEFAQLARRTDVWMVCGSRHGRKGMPFRRRILSGLFHIFVWCVGVRGVHDTQCGFKLFRMDVMRAVFERQRIERFSFDVELIRRVLRAGGTVAEVPIAWYGGRRSSLRIFRDAPKMLWDLLRLVFAIRK